MFVADRFGGCYRYAMEATHSGNGEWHDQSGAEEAHAAAPQVTCPACGEAFANDDAPEASVLECPACQAQFFAASESNPDDQDDAPREAQAADVDTEFNNLRVRKITALRRGLYRTRNLVTVGMITLLVAAVQLVWQTIQVFEARRSAFIALGCAAGAVVCLICARSLRRRMRAIDRELSDMLQQEPTAEPDFSTLSDGSQGLKHLEWLSERAALPPSDAIDMGEGNARDCG